MSQILSATVERPRQTARPQATDAPTGEKPQPPAGHTQTEDLQRTQTVDPPECPQTIDPPERPQTIDLPRTQFPTSYRFSQPALPRVQEEQVPSEDFYRGPLQQPRNQFTGFPPAIPADPGDLYGNTPARQPPPSGHSRELANMSKIYTDDMKYGDGQDNFNLKLVIFYDICARVDLPNTVYKRALPIMLKGRASEYYYTGLIQNNLDFGQLCTAIEQHFEDANHR
jgi:hypothetical protein